MLGTYQQNDTNYWYNLQGRKTFSSKTKKYPYLLTKSHRLNFGKFCKPTIDEKIRKNWKLKIFGIWFLLPIVTLANKFSQVINLLS